MIIDKLIEKIIKTNNPTVVGLDTKLSYLPEKMTASVKNAADAAKAIKEFNFSLIDDLKKIVPAVKVQIAYYEALGIEGLKVFCETCKYAKDNDLIVMADAKRGDIGSTADEYADAFLGENIFGKTEFCSDFLTVNSYLGSDGIKPFVERCKTFDKGLFVLVKTSNPSSGELQNLKLEDGKQVYHVVAEIVSKSGIELIGKYGYSSIGAVVGATHPQEAEILRKLFPKLFFLVPGYGAQGAKAEDVAVNFDANGRGAIVNSSRGILCAYKQEQYSSLSFTRAAVEAALEMKQALTKYIEIR